MVAVNRWHEPSEIDIPAEFAAAKPVFGGMPINGKLQLPAEGFAVLVIMRNSELKAPCGVVMFIGSLCFDIRQKEGSLFIPHS